MAPGPTPTLTTSAPASISSRVPSAVTTLPATTGVDPATERTARSASIAFSWWPCAVSTTRTSTPAASRAAALPATSPLMPTAAEVSRSPVGVHRRRVERRAQRALAGDHADQPVALDHRGRADPRVGQHVEDLRQVGAGRDGQRVRRHDLGELGEPVDVLARAVGDDADRDAVLDHDDDRRARAWSAAPAPRRRWTSGRA